MVWLYIFLGILGGIIILLFLSLFVIYHGVFYTPLKNQNDDYFLTPSVLESYDPKVIYQMIDELKAIPYEDTYIKSFDKLKLHARIYKNPDSKTVVIMCHGYRGTAYRDFSGGAVDMIKRGYNVILIDERGHGLSKGHSITFGNKEQKDLLSWIDYAKETFGNDIKLVLVGISMGGATVLFAADKVDADVKIIADCPFTSEKEIICDTMENTLHFNPKIFWPITNLSSIIFGHANLAKDDIKKHVDKIKTKILIIHGDSDEVVNYKHSYALYKKAPDKIRYELFPGAKHGLSYLTDKDRYQKVVSEFLEE